MAVEEERHELCEYELKRLERINKNEAYLASLGLAKPKEQMMRAMTQKTYRQKKRRLLKVSTPPPGNERRSKRIKRCSSGSNGSSPASANGKVVVEDDDDDDEVLIMLSYAEADDQNLRAVKQRQPNERADEMEAEDGNDIRIQSPYRRSRKLAIAWSEAAIELTEAEKEVLAKSDMDQNYLDKFREFLVYHDKISTQNERNVMRQVTKMANGEGVRYESAKYGWPEGCYFLKGTRVNPLSDLVELMNKAVEAENKWGIDRGNGWLLRHPLKKLLLFQQFCLNNPDFLTAECKLKEYYDL
jgi:hypothetical protein